MCNKMQKSCCSRITGNNEPTLAEELINLIKLAYAQSFDIKSIQVELKLIQRRDGETVEEFKGRVYGVLDHGLEVANEKYKSKKMVEIKALLEECITTEFLRGICDTMIMLLISKENLETLRDVNKLAIRLEHQLRNNTESISSKISADVYMQAQKGKRTKLDEKVKEMVLISYGDDEFGYKLVDSSKKMEKIIFDEDESGTEGSDGGNDGNQTETEADSSGESIEYVKKILTVLSKN